MRRVLRNITAPILSNFNRMVVACAFSRSVPFNAMRRVRRQLACPVRIDLNINQTNLEPTQKVKYQHKQ